MSQCRFFTDEDMHAAIAPALRHAGLDAISTPGAGRLGSFDEEQLRWAAGEGRAVVSFNIRDFAALHSTWLKQGRHHAGIVLSTQRSAGDVIRRIRRLAAALDADAMRDRLEFLSNW